MEKQLDDSYDSTIGMTIVRKNAVVQNIRNAATMEKDGHHFHWMTVKDFKQRFWFEAGYVEGWSFDQQVRRQCIFCEICGNYTQLSSIEEQEKVPQNCWCFCDLPELEPISLTK